jgi:hypothetical protein
VPQLLISPLSDGCGSNRWLSNYMEGRAHVAWGSDKSKRFRHIIPGEVWLPKNTKRTHISVLDLSIVALHKTQHRHRKWWVASMVEYCHVLRHEGIREPSALGMGICGPSSPMYKDKRRGVRHRVHSPAPQCVSNGRSVHLRIHWADWSQKEGRARRRRIALVACLIVLYISI